MTVTCHRSLVSQVANVLFYANCISDLTNEKMPSRKTDTVLNQHLVNEKLKSFHAALRLSWPFPLENWVNKQNVCRKHS